MFSMVKNYMSKLYRIYLPSKEGYSEFMLIKFLLYQLKSIQTSLFFPPMTHLTVNSKCRL